MCPVGGCGGFAAVLGATLAVVLSFVLNGLFTLSRPAGDGEPRTMRRAASEESSVSMRMSYNNREEGQPGRKTETFDGMVPSRVL